MTKIPDDVLAHLKAEIDQSKSGLASIVRGMGFFSASRCAETIMKMDVGNFAEFCAMPNWVRELDGRPVSLFQIAAFIAIMDAIANVADADAMNAEG